MRALPLRGSTIAVSLTAALVLAGCTATGSSSSSPEGDASGRAATDTIRATIDIPAGFDPAKGVSLPDFLLARQSYDTLVRRDSGGVVGGLATSWTSTPTSASFVLRADATCDDGTPITPTVAARSLERYADPETAASTTVTVFGPGNEPTIVADDAAGTLEITVPTPWDLVGGLTLATTGIVCPAGLAEPKSLAAGAVKGASSGPYQLTASQAGVSYTYTLRSDYETWPAWESAPAGKPATTLQFSVSPDPTATSNLVMNNQLDIAKINADSMTRFEDSPDFSVSVNRFSDFYVVFNERPGTVFADPAARKAVAQAIDRAAIAKVISKGTGEELSYLASETTPCWDDDTSFVPPTDTAAAANVLDGRKIRIVGAQVVGTNGAGNTYLQEVLRAAGAEVELQNLDVGTWVSKVFGAPDEWDLTIFADLNFIGSLASPVLAFIGPTVDQGGGNLGAVDNEAAAASLAAGLEAADPDARCAGLRDSNRALVEAYDAVPLVNDPFIYAVRKGFSVTMLGGALDDPILRIE